MLRQIQEAVSGGDFAGGGDSGGGDGCGIGCMVGYGGCGGSDCGFVAMKKLVLTVVVVLVVVMQVVIMDVRWEVVVVMVSMVWTE